jgi:FkbM family methyltransferase
MIVSAGRSALRRLWSLFPESSKGRLRGSTLYRELMRFAYPDRKKLFDDQVRFHSDLFRSLHMSPRLIFDIGANCGENVAVYSALGAAVLAVEPTPELVEHLRQRFRADPRVSVEACAASASAGTTTLWRVSNSAAMNTISPKTHELLAGGDASRTPDHLRPQFGEPVQVETKTLDMLVKERGRPDYVKIDAEGHDKDIIAGLSKPVPLVSFEAALPEFLEESLVAIDLLCALSPSARFQARQWAGFILPGWVSGDEIKDVLRRQTPYLDIFASMT